MIAVSSGDAEDPPERPLGQRVATLDRPEDADVLEHQRGHGQVVDADPEPPEREQERRDRGHQEQRDQPGGVERRHARHPQQDEQRQQQDEHEPEQQHQPDELEALAGGGRPRLTQRELLADRGGLVTWATMPVTRIRPSDCSRLPSRSEPNAPNSPAASSPVKPSEPGPGRGRPSHVSTAVTATGISMATAVTSTAEPTVAFGLKRMIRNAASYMSPSWSGRSAIAPGLWAAPSMPGGGGWYGVLAAGTAVGTRGGYPGGAYPGRGYAAGERLGRGRWEAASRAVAGLARRLVPARARGRIGLGSRHPGILSGRRSRHRVSQRRRELLVVRFPEPGVRCTPRHVRFSPAGRRKPPARSQRIWPAPTSLPR